MAYGQTHTATLPTVGVTPQTTFATLVNAALEEIRTTLNSKVTPAGMDMNADLSMRSGATFYGIMDAHRVSLQSQGTALSAATYPGAVYNNQGNLYYNDASGNQIALTSSGSIAGSAGSISGAGYGAPVELNWDSGSSTYNFYSAAATYANVRMADLLLSDGSSNFLKLEAASMASDYTVTWPAALPAVTTSLLTITTAGVMAYTATPTVTTLNTTGALVAGTTLAVGTTSTFTGKPTFTVEYAHPQRTRHITPMEMASDDTSFTHTSDNPRQLFTVNGTLFIPLFLEEGERLESVTIWITTSATAGTRYFDIGYWNNTVGAYQWPAGGYRATTAVTSDRQAVTLNTTDITVSNPSGSGTQVGFLALKILAIAGDNVHGVRVQYSRQ